MAEQIRDIASQEPEQIRQQIDETRSAITEKLEALEEQVTDTVQNVKDSVQDTIESTRETVQETVSTIKETVQETVTTVKETFDLRLQVERHPWPMLGGALVAGVVTGALVGEARHRRTMPVERLRSNGEPMMRHPEREESRIAPPARRPGIFDRFHDEIAQVKGMALGMVFGVVRDVIQENLPQMADQVGEVMDRLTTKFGGEPVKGPVLHRPEEGPRQEGRRAYSTAP
jgi:ElaB/YqjD/DUF883 family membrane-anchored ribosome-binding protein